MNNELENVKVFLSKLGFKILSPLYYENIYKWIGWYKGEIDEFHKYKMYNGFQFVDKKRASLKMPKRVSEEWSSLLYNDKVYLNVDENDQKTLDEILVKNRFNYKFSELLERTFALGTGALVEYKDENGNARISYIIAPMIFPLREENGEIIDCAFGSVKGDAIYLNIHTEENGLYTIQNKIYKKIDNIYQLQESEDMEEEFTSPVKMFQIIKPNIANNIDLFTPFGLSVFENALEQNKAIDMTYDSLKNEFDLGKKRLFVRSDTLTYKTVVGIDKNGNPTSEEIPIFDREQTEFFALPGEAEDKPITEVNPQLRITEHIDGLQTELNLFSDTCGLGPDRFVFKDGKVYTNSDQVISTQSKLYKNIVNHEKILNYALIDMIRSLMYLVNNIEYKKDITINFDDSIIEDSKETRTQAILEFNNGLIDDIQYYMDVYKMSEEQATKFRSKIKERSPEQPIEDEPPQGV